MFLEQSDRTKEKSDEYRSEISGVQEEIDKMNNLIDELKVQHTT